MSYTHRHVLQQLGMTGLATDDKRRIAKFSRNGVWITPLLLGVNRMYSYSSYCH